MRSAYRRDRGVSLIEALVALAVMAFGTLAVLGVQGSLRMNADIAKQRSEAVRIAQELIEQRRAYDAIQDAVANAVPDYVDITATVDPLTIEGYTTNTTYSASIAVEEPAASVSSARRKTVTATISWTDRTDTAQSVALSTVIQGTPPELGGSLGVPGDAAVVRKREGRNPAIPVGAIPVEGNPSASRYEPPGSGGVAWVFNNISGAIIQRCLGADCVAFSGRLLSGYIRFATLTSGGGSVAPTGVDAEFPLGVVVSGVQVHVAQTAPTEYAGTVECYEDTQAAYVAYYCAIPVETIPLPTWSGQSLVDGLSIADDVADARADRRRVCRYTPYRAQLVVPTEMRNDEHPLDYVDVTTPLVQQNFLVIAAGDGTSAFECPDDDASTPFLNGTTWRHQPAL